MDISFRGFRCFLEGEVRSMDPDSKKKSAEEDQEDHLDALDDELGADWKTAVMKDRVVIQEPIEMGHYVYKTSAWRVLDTDDEQVTIQLDVDGTPNLAHNVFRKKHNGELERVGPDGPYDTEPHTIPREMFVKLIDAALRAQQKQGGAGGGPPGGPPGMGGPPGGPPGMGGPPGGPMG